MALAKNLTILKDIECQAPNFSSECIPFAPPQLIQEFTPILGCQRVTNIQSLMIPAVYCCRNMVSIGGENTGKTFGYLLPLLSKFILGFNSFEALSSESVYATILCPTKSDVFKVIFQIKFILKEYKISLPIASYINTNSLGSEKPALIITTPDDLALYEDMYIHCSMLILDNLDEMISTSEYIIIKALRRFKRNKSTISQVIVTAKSWTFSIAELVRKFIPLPVFGFTSFIGAFLFKRIEILFHSLPEDNEVTAELKNLILRAKGLTSTVICTSSSLAVKPLFSFDHSNILLVIKNDEISKNSIRLFKRHPYKKLLLVSDTALELLENVEVSTLIHFGLPQHYKLFEQRMKLLLPFKSDKICSCHIFSTEADFSSKYVSEFYTQVSKYKEDINNHSVKKASKECKAVKDLPPYEINGFIFADLADEDFLRQYNKDCIEMTSFLNL